jgi:ketosteroid isomerase-like protein
MKKIYSVFRALFFKRSSNNLLEDGEQLLANWVNAVNQCDVNAVMQLFAADVMFYGTSTKTLITSSEGVRQYFEQAFAQLQPLTMSIEDKKIQSVSDAVMLLACSDSWTVTLNGQQQIMFGRLVMTAAIKQGVWKIVSFHRSALPE